MLRKMMLLGTLLTFVSMATCAFAQDVYVTKSGKKFHKETCALIKNKQTVKLQQEEAVQKGLSPCKKCFATETPAEGQK